ncbi:MAG: TlpA disulfide reductase family protein [Acidimicrobiales bacterium]
MAQKKKSKKKSSNYKAPGAKKKSVATKPVAREPEQAEELVEETVKPAKQATQTSPVQQRSRGLSATAQIRVLVGVAAVFVVGMFFWAAWGSRSEDGVTTATAWDLPAEANDANDDGRIQLIDYGGTPLVVNFFANWCTACDAEMPGFSTVSAEMQGTVQFVGVHTREDGGALDLPRKHGLDWWPIARDINGQFGGGSGLYDSLRNSDSMPLTAFYDSNGNFLRATSTLSESQLRGIIDELYGVT